MSTRPRMSDLAESAGVSISTVSRVLNGKPGIREDTRQAVLQAMTDLGYSREKIAATQRSDRVSRPRAVKSLLPCLRRAPGCDFPDRSPHGDHGRRAVRHQ